VPGDGRVDVQVTLDERALKTLAPEIVRLTDLEVDGRRLELSRDEVAPTPNRAGLATVHLAGSLPAGASVIRWRASFLPMAYPVTVVGGSTEVAPDSYEWIAGREWSRLYRIEELGAKDGPWRAALRLIPTGFTHILPAGLDHVFFMLGLFLMASTRRALLLQVSAFTLAHSLTLALGAFGAVSIPSRIIEPLIAASIAFIAIENIFATSVSRWRIFVVFVFGLLHGLGFAGAMADLGLSGRHLVASLVGFNAGVELGQLAVILAASLVVRALRLPVDAERQFVLRPASAAIALMGLFWAFERTVM
jgi:hypothetical protein